MKKILRKKSRGQGIVSVIIAAGVGAIVLGFLTDMLVQQGISQKFITQKLEMNDLTGNLITTFSRSENCTCQFANDVDDNPNYDNNALLKFDITAPARSQVIDVKKVYAGCKVGTVMPLLIAQEGLPLPNSSSLRVDKVEFVNLEPTGGELNEWQGQWRISFQVGSGSAIRSVRPVVVTQKVIVTPNGANTRITSCKGLSSGSGTQDFLAKWSPTSGVLKNSIVFEDETNSRIGIGTQTPSASLTVKGATGSIKVMGTQNIADPASMSYSQFVSLDDDQTLSKSIGYVGDGASGHNGMMLVGHQPAGVVVAAFSGGAIEFLTSSTFLQADTFSRLRILNNGNVGIGNTNPGSLLTLGSGTTRGTLSIFGTGPANPGALTFSDPSAGGHSYTIYNGISAPGSLFIFDQTAAASRLVINSSGDIAIGGNTAPAYKLDVGGDINTSTCFRIGATAVSGTCTSDIRLKENIQDYNQGLKELLGIRLRTFRFNGLGEMPKTGETAVGAIAQEVERTNPDLVKTRIVKLYPESQEKTLIKNVDYSKFTYMLINAVKELYREFLGLQKKNAEQDSQISFLEANIANQNVVAEKIQKIESENEKLKQENAAIKLWICTKEPSATFCNL